jgi:capsular polysaccharide transport system permease protein
MEIEEVHQASLVATIANALLKPPPRTGPGRSPNFLQRIRWLPASFLLLVIVPSVVVAAYYSFIATPQYASEARFVVRTAESSAEATTGEASMALAGVPLNYSLNAQNAFVVAQYIRSRAVLEDLKPIIDIRTLFRRPEVDFWARLEEPASMEDLLDYWKDMVRSYVDAPSGIVTVEIRAFRPTDAQEILNAVMLLSERLVNQMSERAHQDIVRSSEEEVRRAHAAVGVILGDLQTLRDRVRMIDPVKTADDDSKLLMKLLAEKITTESDLFVASQSLDANSPTVRLNRTRLETIEAQIAALRAKLTGKSLQGTVAESIRYFEELEIKKVLAEKLLTFSEGSLERARIRAERQNLYFMVFAPPALPMKAKYPLRMAYSLLIPVALIILWGIGALLTLTIEDHRF